MGRTLAPPQGAAGVRSEGLRQAPLGAAPWSARAGIDQARVSALRAAVEHASPAEDAPGPWTGPDLPDEREGIEDRMRLLGYL